VPNIQQSCLTGPSFGDSTIVPNEVIYISMGLCCEYAVFVFNWKRRRKQRPATFQCFFTEILVRQEVLKRLVNGMKN
jgi:hypothetical protein